MAEGKLPRRFVDLDLGLLFGSGSGIRGRITILTPTRRSVNQPAARQDRPKLRSESARDEPGARLRAALWAAE